MSDFRHPPATVQLGSWQVPRVGFGAMQLPGPGVWGEPDDPAQARAVLRRVIDLGIRLIDTSWYYGPHVANQLIAETLRPYPEGLVIATKLGGRRTPDKAWAPALTPEQLNQGCEEDLKTLRVSELDVVHLRWMPTAGVPFLEALDAMIALKAAGKIRHLGISNVTLSQLQQALERTEIVSVQNLYNAALGERALHGFEYAVVTEQEAIVDLCTERKIAFLPFFPLNLPGRPPASPTALTRIAAHKKVSTAQIASAWLLARSPIMVPIAGTKSLAHLEENWNARAIELSADEIAQISAER